MIKTYINYLLTAQATFLLTVIKDGRSISKKHTFSL
jgi:hypothetical protein